MPIKNRRFIRCLGLPCLLWIALALNPNMVLAEAIEVAAVSIETISKREFQIEIDGCLLNVSILDTVLRSKKDLLLDWIAYSAQVVHHYYGRFPVDRVDISLDVTDGPNIRFGQAFGGDSPFIRIVTGEDVTRQTLSKDWIIVHEMVHLAMADLPKPHRWLLEGLATYVESIARAQLGYLTEDFVWNGFINRMPQGLPQEADRGLDHTPTWGRTYWGGAIYCLLADIEIRKLSHNKKSLRDALRGILNDGFSMKTSATAEQIFASGDKATGVDVLLPLYQKLRAEPIPIDLEALWESLGVSLQDDRVIYNNEAKLSHIRQQILKP